ncbi:major capsid protein [Loigolactobacillus bifermentans]|uniref:Major capsid protein E n=1 Tax=Loigolactobacillus bifermentans DSM 20003 TaxID=1423726 RepID=A0A0R1H333_9LACO|nr:major capsid protein [Loigolactobacillus bifermentans]KRK40805.1 hypothetical protein FC07_GL002554 [Loigolactobacillus bifermentans DSM 20003]QGG59557.1 major capsid protein E [Loigolactobacillus bifermentans]
MNPEVISMFADLTSANIASYWTTLQQKEAPYLGETLFPNVKQDSDVITFYRGLTRAPKALNPSALDAQAIVRDRQGFNKITTQTNFYKESKYLDENLRRELSRLASSADQTRRDIIIRRIFDDTGELMRGAALGREIQRMQVLLTGKYEIKGNGQVFSDDYYMQASHLAQAVGKWGETGSSPTDDIKAAKDLIGTEQGVTLTRMLVNEKTFNALLRDEEIKATLFTTNINTQAMALPKSALLSYLSDQFGLEVVVYEKGYVDVTGKFNYFIPDGKVVFMPGVALGNTVFSPTPEETDLALSKVADVSFADTGVAITTTPHSDPVTKETKVSQQYSVSYEQIDSVYILDAFNPKA